MPSQTSKKDLFDWLSSFCQFSFPSGEVTLSYQMTRLSTINAQQYRIEPLHRVEYNDYLLLSWLCIISVKSFTKDSRFWIFCGSTSHSILMSHPSKWYSFAICTSCETTFFNKSVLLNIWLHISFVSTQPSTIIVPKMGTSIESYRILFFQLINV